MKAIINGLRYDTDKAILIGEDYANCPRSDFAWWSAGLFKTPRSGRFFLAGRGGPMTQFSHPYGQNGSQGGEKIIPMSAEEAREWAERYLTTDEVETAFSAAIQDA
jgi:hypothetical protein